MKRCPNGKRRVGRICKRKPKARAKAKRKVKKSPLTKYFIRGNRAKGTKKRYLTQRELNSIRAQRAREAQGRRDAKRARRVTPEYRAQVARHAAAIRKFTNAMNQQAW